MTLYKCPICCEGDIVTDNFAGCQGTNRESHSCPKCERAMLVIEEQCCDETKVTFVFKTDSIGFVSEV